MSNDIRITLHTTAGDIDHLNMDRAYLGGGYTGSWPGGNGGWSWFTGQIDEAAIYDYPLTEQTVAEHYALRTGSAQLTRTTLPSGRTSAQVQTASRDPQYTFSEASQQHESCRG